MKAAILKAIITRLVGGACLITVGCVSLAENGIYDVVLTVDARDGEVSKEDIIAYHDIPQQPSFRRKVIIQMNSKSKVDFGWLIFDESRLNKFLQTVIVEMHGANRISNTLAFNNIKTNGKQVQIIHLKTILTR